MALLFWGRCKEPIVTGLIAAKINWWVLPFIVYRSLKSRNLLKYWVYWVYIYIYIDLVYFVDCKLYRHLSEFESNKLACDEDNAEMLSNQGFEFELMACSVMSECYRLVIYTPSDWLIYVRCLKYCDLIGYCIMSGGWNTVPWLVNTSRRRFDRKDWTKILTAPRPMVNKMDLIQLAKNISADNFIAEVGSYLVVLSRLWQYNCVNKITRVF